MSALTVLRRAGPPMPTESLSQHGSQDNLANGHRQPALAVPPWLRAASGQLATA